MLAALVGVILLTGGDDEVATDDTTTTSEGTVTTEGPTTTSARPGGGAGGEPDGIVAAVDSGGRLVVLDAESGRVVRVLAEGIRVDDPAKNAVAVTPDQSTAFFVDPGVVGEAASDAEVLRVPTTGSAAPEVVANGFAPAVSPDGEQLAYVRTSATSGDILPEPVIVIRDLDTGAERTLAREEEESFAFIADLAWSAGGDWLAFVAGEVQTSVWVVEPGAADLDGARALGPRQAGREDGTTWRAATAYDEGLAVAEACCDERGSERALVLLVSIEPAAVEGGLLPEERVDVFRLDTESDADQLLYIEDGGPRGGRLMRWSAGEDPVELSDGIVVAAW